MGLPVLRVYSFKFNNTSNNPDSTVCLRCNHDFDQVSASWLSMTVKKYFQISTGDVNSNNMVMLSFQFIQDMDIFEGSLCRLRSLLQLFKCLFVDCTISIDQMASPDGLAQIYCLMKMILI